jgi:hypothetical protein
MSLSLRKYVTCARDFKSGALFRPPAGKTGEEKGECGRRFCDNKPRGNVCQTQVLTTELPP